ncbi:MAG: hypothetical protein ACLRRT_02295 [Ruthenibacterium lactatiformans]
MSIPVYLFTGFLDAGKTAFIQETLEDPGFNTGEKTLVLLCEEGENEYRPAKVRRRKRQLSAGGGAGRPDHRFLKTTRKNTVWTACSLNTTVCGLQALYDALPTDWISTRSSFWRTLPPSPPI